MKAGLWSRAAIASTALALACRGGTEDVGSRFDVRAEYAKVTAAHVRLASARDRLDREQALRSGPTTAPEATGRDLKEAQIAYDEAFAHNQKELARFLSTALNEAPDRPETKEALDSFAGEAVASARYVLDHGADPQQTVGALGRAERAYRMLGLGVPNDLAAVLQEIRQMPAVRPTPTVAPTNLPPPHPAKRRLRKR